MSWLQDLIDWLRELLNEGSSSSYSSSSSSSTSKTSLTSSSSSTSKSIPKGSLKIGQTHKVKVDGFTGKEDHTKSVPSKDNPEFVRKLVERAYTSSGKSYWYSSRHVGGRNHKWVDYKPDFKKLGGGKYKISIVYRATRNRASYPAVYQIIRNGKVEYVLKKVQRSESSYFAETILNNHYMSEGDFVRVLDNVGTSSICMGEAKFKKLTYGTGTIPPPTTGIKKEVLFEAGGHGFMCMSRLSNGQILMGEYSGSNTSKLWCYGTGLLLKVPTGESIFRICEDNGRVYMALENYKIVWDVLRSDPKEYKFSKVITLDPGPHDGAWDIKRVNDKLIYLGGGEIQVDGKTVKRWGNEYYVKKLVHLKGIPIAVGYNIVTENAGWLHGGKWKWIDKTPRRSGNRFMSGVTNKKRDILYLVGTVNYKGGHHSDSACIWTFEKNRLSKPIVFDGFDYSSCAELGPDDNIYFGVTKTWIHHIPGAKLMQLSNGNVKEIVKFDESELRSIAFDENNILCATRSHGKRGRLYKISGVLKRR